MAEKFWNVAPYVKWGALCESLRVFTNLFQMLGHAERKNKKLIFAYLLSPILVFSMLYSLLDQHKIEAIGPSLFAGFLICLLTLTFTYRKYSVQLLNFKELKSLAFNILGKEL